jgi:prepilin-type N-terminal cleavage/methylation domain-containing protein
MTIRQPSGFTLIELIIYVVLIGIVSTVFVSFAFNVIGSGEKARVNQELQQNARFALDRVLQEIRSATAVNTGGSTFAANPGVLSLSTSSVLNNPTIFDVSGNVLRIKLGATTAVPLTDSKYQVIDFTVENLSVSNRTSNLRVTLSMRHPNTANEEIYDAQTTLIGAAHVRAQAD